MSELNRKEIISELEELGKFITCPEYINDALRVIEELTDENERLRAENLYDKGYRKASEVAREIIDTLKSAGIDEWRYPVIAELKKMYLEDKL